MGVVWLRHEAYSAGKRDSTLVAVRAKVETLTVRVHTRDTIYRRVRDSFVVASKVYDSVRVTDTLVRNDTVFIPRAVADTAINLCRRTLIALGSSCATKDTLITALRANVKAEHDAKPGFVRLWVLPALASVMAFLAGWIK